MQRGSEAKKQSNRMAELQEGRTANSIDMGAGVSFKPFRFSGAANTPCPYH